MKPLTNTLPKDVLMEIVRQENFKRTTISFYRYVHIEEPEKLRDDLYIAWKKIGVLGRIYVAKEGINAQLNIPEHNMNEFRNSVNSFNEFKDVLFKIGITENGISFWKLTIIVKKFILADGLPHNEYDVTNVGTHLNAKEFNKAINNGALVVDMRNNYESDIGYFEGAIKPDVHTFKEELPLVLETLKGKEKEKVLLYCTGGIRCEKTSAYLKHHGFKDVNQLHGGIIDYKHQIDREGLKSKYIGVNYVFDGRTNESITNDLIGKCYTCKEPSNTYIDCENLACHVLFVQCAACQNKLQKCCSENCVTIKQLPAEEQKKLRKGKRYVGPKVLRTV